MLNPGMTYSKAFLLFCMITSFCLPPYSPSNVHFKFIDELILMLLPCKYKKFLLLYCLNNILKTNGIGIDLGIKDLAICSDGNKYKNINKTYVVRKIEKRLKNQRMKYMNMKIS